MYDLTKVRDEGLPNRVLASIHHPRPGPPGGTEWFPDLSTAVDWANEQLADAGVTDRRILEENRHIVRLGFRLQSDP
jgi:hypothetical protein